MKASLSSSTAAIREATSPANVITGKIEPGLTLHAFRNPNRSQRIGKAPAAAPDTDSITDGEASLGLVAIAALIAVSTIALVAFSV